MLRIRSVILIILILVGLVGFHSLGTAQTGGWTPPVAIPAPSFGIGGTARARPSPWTAPSTNYYYVDATVAAATDTNNTYGTPAKPRRTIPRTVLPAGSVVELHGTYAYEHTSPQGITSAGTAASPVFIRGAGPAERPTVTGCWEMSGSYYVVEYVEFSQCGSISILAPSDHAALRHSDVHGNLNGGGVGIESWNGATVHDAVLWDNLIHDNGDVGATFDQDIHGIAIGPRVSYLWVVDNQIYRNSGDGIQINGSDSTLQSTTHHIFVGRNQSHDNKQNGFWTKQSVDVIFSQNLSYNHRPSDSSPGACMGGQDAPEFVWFIANILHDCDNGIVLASDSDLGSGHDQFFIGNWISRIHDSDGGFQPGSAWQNCALSLPGGTARIVIENSLYDNDSGICVPGSQGVLYLADNLVQKVRSNGHHVIFDSPAMVNQTGAASNLFAPNFRLGVGGTVFTALTTQVAKGANSLVGDVGWIDPAGGNFFPTATSPARSLGIMNTLGIWEFFQNRYGVSLARDAAGIARDSTPEAGALATTRPDPRRVSAPQRDVHVTGLTAGRARRQESALETWRRATSAASLLAPSGRHIARRALYRLDCSASLR